MMEYIEAITRIANDPRLIKHLEPNIFPSQIIEGWMVKRILYAWGLLENELSKDTGGTISEADIPDARSICCDTKCV